MPRLTKTFIVVSCISILALALTYQSLPAQNETNNSSNSKKKQSAHPSYSVGDLTFQYTNKLQIKNFALNRKDIVCLSYLDPPPGISIFFVAPLLIADSLSKDKLAATTDSIRDDLIAAIFKEKNLSFQWRPIPAGIPISKYENSSSLTNGWNGSKTISFDVRHIKYKQKNFLVGLIQEQCKGRDAKKSFEKDELCRDNFFQLIYSAQIAASVTNEPKPDMWPPPGRPEVQGIPIR